MDLADNVNKSKERVQWIDCAKTIAMIAVVVDHCYGILYSTPAIAQMSYFSTSLFVMLSGISVWISVQGGKQLTFRKQLNKISKLFIQYALATFFVLIYSIRFFDLRTYISWLINFSAQPPYYYFVFFFQLLLITPVLAKWCRYCSYAKGKVIWHLGTLCCLCGIAFLSIHYTYLLPVYGGGQNILGGTFIIMYYAGMVLASLKCFSAGARKKIVIFIVSLIGWIIWWRGIAQGKLLFDFYLRPVWGDGFNPPSFNFMVFAVITLFLCYSFFSLCEKDKGKWLVKVVAYIGKNTLYIFMYHCLFRDMAVDIFKYYGWSMENIGIRLLVFALLVIFPVLLKDILLKSICFVKRQINIIDERNKIYENSEI